MDGKLSVMVFLEEAFSAVLGVLHGWDGEPFLWLGMRNAECGMFNSEFVIRNAEL